MTADARHTAAMAFCLPACFLLFIFGCFFAVACWHLFISGDSPCHSFSLDAICNERCTEVGISKGGVHSVHNKKCEFHEQLPMFYVAEHDQHLLMVSYTMVYYNFC